MKPWEVITSRYLLKRWWMNVREDHVRLPNGAELSEFHVLEYPDWTCVVCLTDKDELIMVEQYRHGVERFSLELPAGAVEPGEELLAAAKRELLEETGFAADNWTEIGKCAPEPSKHTNWAHIYIARQARRISSPNPDESEHLRVHLIQPEQVYRLVSNGSIFHGTHLTALFWAAREGLLTIDQASTGQEDR